MRRNPDEAGEEEGDYEHEDEEEERCCTSAVLHGICEMGGGPFRPPESGGVYSLKTIDLNLYRGTL